VSCLEICSVILTHEQADGLADAIPPWNVHFVEEECGVYND
jgi:hypothetical protein